MPPPPPEPEPQEKPDAPAVGDSVPGEAAENAGALDNGKGEEKPGAREAEQGSAALSGNGDPGEEEAAAKPHPPGQAPPGGADAPPQGDRKPSFLERQEYRVRLPVFNGPLDLLLYLIKRDEIDIQDIPIAHVAKEYVAFLDLMAEWNINAAGDFLLMAATLMEVKSRMLLPEPPPLEADEEEWEDPRAELVRQLMEYKRYKEAAMDLADRAEERAMRFSRPGERVAAEEDEDAPPPVLGVDVWRLAEAFREILEATGADAAHRVVMDETPQEVFMERLRHRIEAEGRMLFRDLFGEESHRAVLIGMFLALLELCRLLEVRAEQPEPEGDIWVAYVPPEQRGAAMPMPEAAEGEPERPRPSRRPWTFGENMPKAPAVEFIADEIDAELDSIGVRDVREAPPKPEPDAAVVGTAEDAPAPNAEGAESPQGEQTETLDGGPEPAVGGQGAEFGDLPPAKGAETSELGEAAGAPAFGPSEIAAAFRQAVTVSAVAALPPPAEGPAALSEHPPETSERPSAPEEGEPPADEAETVTVAIDPEDAPQPEAQDGGGVPQPEAHKDDGENAEETQTVALESVGEGEGGAAIEEGTATKEEAGAIGKVTAATPERCGATGEEGASAKEVAAAPEEEKPDSAKGDVAEEGRQPFDVASARIRWLGLFGLCPCKFSVWLRVEAADEGCVVVLSRRRLWLWRRMAVGMALKAEGVPRRIRLKGRVESRERAAPGEYRLRIRLAPFGPEPGRNAPASIKVLRELARTVGCSR